MKPYVVKMDDWEALKLVDERNGCKRKLAELRALVKEQTEDGGVWFTALTAPEAYLQQELRRLHEAIGEV